MNSYMLNPEAVLFGGEAEGDFMVRIGPYPQWTQATIQHSLSIAAHAETSPDVSIRHHPTADVLYEPFVNFARAFTAFLQWMITDHAAAVGSAEDKYATNLHDGGHDDAPSPHDLASQLPEDIKVWLAQTTLQQLRCTLHILRSPTTRELCVTFQINHSSELTLTTTAQPAHSDTLRTRLRHLLLCYRSVAPYLGAQVLDNSFQIASAYLLAPAASEGEELIHSHVWGQPKIRWQYLRHNRQLDPFSPYLSHYEFYAAVWNQVIQLVGPGTPTAKDRHSIWVAGDTDGSLGLRLCQEGHDLVSFHCDQESSQPSYLSAQPRGSYWQQLHALNPNLSTANVHYIDLTATEQETLTSCWSHDGTDPKRRLDFSQDIARLPTYLIIIANSPASEEAALDMTRQLLQRARQASSHNSVPPATPHFLILITAHPLHQLWNNLHSPVGASASTPPEPPSFQHHIQTLGYGQKQCIGFEMIPPGTSARGGGGERTTNVLRRLFVSLYEAQPVQTLPAQPAGEPT